MDKESASQIPELVALGQAMQTRNNGLRYKASHYTISVCRLKVS